MRPTWHVIRGSKVRVPVHPPVNRGPLATPRVTSLGSIKPRLLLPQLLNLRTTLIACQESSSQEGANSFGAESSQKDDEGLFIPSYLEEALPDDPTLQVKMACAMRAQEVETRRCFTCNQQGHLQRDHWKYEEKNGTGPLQPKGSTLNKSAQERAKPKPPPSGQTTSQANPPK